jgi:signal peptidase I
MDWVKTIVIALGLALAIRWAVVEPFKIPSGSMQPTLNGDPRFMRGDRVFVNKWRYGLRWPTTKTRIWHGADPERFDIVVFKAVAEDAPHKILVKRIVGMPGEKIQIRRLADDSGKTGVFINDALLELPPDMQEAGIQYTLQGAYGVRPEEQFSVIPEGHYLVLGDNSGHSSDGRYFGWVPNGNLLGRVYAIWWTPANIRDVTGFTDSWVWRICASMVGAWVIMRLFLGRTWRIRGEDFRDVVRSGERVFINRLRFGLSLPFTRFRLTKGRPVERGELVLYHNTSGEHSSEPYLLGHVAGLPGERVTLEKGRLHVDREAVEHAVLGERTYASSNGEAKYGRGKNKEYTEVPAGHVFVLAGESADSVDSRVIGWVPVTLLVGKASRICWPVSSWGRIET